jgi:hypothetical protein
MTRRATRRSAISVLALFAIAAVSGLAITGVVAPAAHARKAPPAMKVKATNGYKLFVYAIRGDQTNPGTSVSVLAKKGTTGALYRTTKAEIGRNSIEARFRKLGFIDMRFVPNGSSRLKTAPGGCDRIPTAMGRFEGSFEFRGERGFTRVRAKAGKPVARPIEFGSCGGFAGYTPQSGYMQGISRSAPGQVVPPNYPRYFTVWVHKYLPESPTTIRVGSSELSGPLSISRQVDVVAPPSAFVYDSTGGVLSGSFPFAGSARFTATPAPCDVEGVPSGTLTVAMPGLGAVSLTDGSIRYEIWVPGGPKQTSPQPCPIA